MSIFRQAAIAAACVLTTFQALPAQAAMTLTATAQSQGYTLTTFASGMPSTGFCCGPLGIEFPTSGGVLVASFTGPIYFFPTDTDNQTPANAIIGTTYPSNQPVDLTRSGGQILLANQGANRIDRLSDTGVFQSTLSTSQTLFAPTGLAVNPITGHLYVSALGGTQGIYEVDPVTGTTSLLRIGQFDGMTVSQDGRHLYAADFNAVQRFSTGVNGAPAFGLEQTYHLSDSVDGTALGTGDLLGTFFANTNSGNLYQVDITTGIGTLIASGGSRGDFVQVDPNDGTLLITQTDSILRLRAPDGGGFETDVPEPASLLLFGSALAMLGASRRRR